VRELRSYRVPVFNRRDRGHQLIKLKRLGSALLRNGYRRDVQTSTYCGRLSEADTHLDPYSLAGT
jgi:hypothetical protein